MQNSLWCQLVWATSILLTLAGIVAAVVGRPTGVALIAIGGSALALFSLATEFRLARTKDSALPISEGIIASGGMGFIVAIALVTGVTPVTLTPAVRGAVLATGIQALVLTVDVNPPATVRQARLELIALSHGVVLAASLVALGWVPRIDPTAPSTLQAVLLAYAVGFSAMALNAFWTRRLRPETVPPRPGTQTRYWESVVLTAVVIGVPSAFVLALGGGTQAVVGGQPLTQAAALVAGISATLAFGSLSAPTSSPAFLRAIGGRLSALLQHGIVIILFVNVLVIAVLLVVPALYVWVLGVFFGLLVFGVALNYLMIVYVHPPDDDEPSNRVDDTVNAEDMAVPAESPPMPDDGVPVTVIVNGFNEVESLSESLPYNLEALPSVQFILLPAAKSNDGTIELMQQAVADHPDRVRLIKGTAGSKAGDLNLVWDAIETPYVLLLDADETIEADFITRGLEVFRNQPNVGVVQGRKLAANPDESRLSRFVSIERQHSTWLDGTFMSDWFDAGHFAGSCAMFRHEVPMAIDGWSPEMLTEDIDMTLRLYLETDWRVEYVAEMVGQELNPQTWWALVSQRERWARGWIEVATKHLPRLLSQWRQLGATKTFGLTWLLLTAVSAPIYTLLPALVVYGLIASPPAIPGTLAVLLALYLLPERGISFFYTAKNDPSLPTPRRRLPSVVAYAYGWILFGWLVQLHSMYLQLAGATGIWHVTKKRGSASGKREPRATKRSS